MSSFDSQLARMKSLMTYGREINEAAKPNNTYTLEHHAVAADGKTYGIVKEFNKFYIKQAQSGSELLAESYNYIGGIMNKKNYEYDSYNKALKNFELKLASINEAHDGHVNVETLDPFKKENIIIEGTEKMKNEIARQRQLMYNTSILMGESKDYAVKGDGCKCDTKQPEAENGKKGDEEYENAKVVEQDKVKSTDGLKKKVGPFVNNPGKPFMQIKEGKACPECGCDECKCGINEDLSTDTDFDEGLKDGLTSQIGDGDPFDDKVTANINEDMSTDTDFDEGLPAFPKSGIGVADTDDNNDPFNKNVTGTLNEEDEDDVEDVEDDVDNLDDEDGEEIDLDDDAEDVEDGVDDFDNDDEIEDVEDDIDDLDDDDEEGEFDVEDGVDALDNEVDETDADSVRKEIERLQGILDDLDGDGYEYDAEIDVEDGDENVEDDVDFPDVDDYEDVDTFDDEEEIDECKYNMMEGVIKNVTRSLLKEDELHDFGKHPGYRKKPFTTPRNGDDRNRWGRDWNDDSVHGEEPFGEKIGDSDPYNQLVSAVAKDVMYQLKHGRIDDKKKGL